MYGLLSSFVQQKIFKKVSYFKFSVSNRVMRYLNSENINTINHELTDLVSHYFNTQTVKTRYFENAQIALYDVIHGLLQFLSHKPKVSMIRKGTSLLEGVLGQFYRIQTPLIFKKDDESFENFAACLDHEVNFTIWSSENELTGEIFLSQQDRLKYHQTLSNRRIYSIEIKSYIEQGDVQILETNPYAIILVTGSIFNQSDCLVLHTEKLKTPYLIAHFQKDLSNVRDQLNSILQKFFIPQNNLSVVPDDICYFNLNKKVITHLNDRYVLYFSHSNGSYFFDHFNLNLELAISPSQFPVWVIDSFQNWCGGYSDEQHLRGLLVLKNGPDAEKLIQQIATENEKLTNSASWTI